MDSQNKKIANTRVPFKTDRATELHAALFPEEYDCVYDSISEAKDRRRGISPMSAEYIAKTNARRKLLGFAPFKETSSSGPRMDTFSWVKEELLNGREDDLRRIVAARAEEDRQEQELRERIALHADQPGWLDRQIDEMLATDNFISKGEDRSDPQIIAFRILGQLFALDSSGTDEGIFFEQIRRVLPDRTEAEYQDLYRHAMNEWMEIYDC